MQAVYPGQPQARLHAIDYGHHEGQLVVAYLSGTTVVLLNGPQSVLQTLKADEDSEDGSEESLIAVKYHEPTGRIAAASKRRIYTYGLREEIKGTLRWSLESTIAWARADGDVEAVSWGADEELLVAGTRLLCLFNPPPTAAAVSGCSRLGKADAVWTRAIPSPVSFAACSPSASLIATLSRGDCLVKIWRRLSFESPQFDYCYLRHPSAVTHIQWRRTMEAASHDRDDDVLFTICADGRFRVWKSATPHGNAILSMFAEIDLYAAIPRDPARSGERDPRFAVVVDSHMIERLADAGEQSTGPVNSSVRHAEEHFRNVTLRKPDVLIVADQYGHMSAWGLESIGCKRRGSGPPLSASPFHITNSQVLDLGMKADVPSQFANTMLHVLPSPGTIAEVTILAHHFDGRITWQQGSLRQLLETGQKPSSRFRRLAEWTGHSTPIKSLVRSANGQALVSRTGDDETVIWHRRRDGRLDRGSAAGVREPIHELVLLRDGNYMAVLHHDKITVWDTKRPAAERVAMSDYPTSSKPLCLTILLELSASEGSIYLAAIDEGMTGQVWELQLPTNGEEKKVPSMRSFCAFQLDACDHSLRVLPVDPAGNSNKTWDHRDHLVTNDVAMSYPATGVLRTYTARINRGRESVEFSTRSTIDTGLADPSFGSASSIATAALVDLSGRRLTIWDTRSGRLDHDHTFKDGIQDLDWAATPQGRSMLAVGFARRVEVLAQLRYDFVCGQSAWARIKEITMPSSIPRRIGGSVWLADGSLAISAGNQMCVSKNTIDVRKDVPEALRPSVPQQGATHIHTLVDGMNAPLPVYHPQFLCQSVLAGKLELVCEILNTLGEKLKFYTDGDELDPLLGLKIEDIVSAGESTGDADSATTMKAERIESLKDLLTRKAIAHLTSLEQRTLVSTVECFGTVSQHARSVDSNARRFLFFWKSALVRNGQVDDEGTHDPSRPAAASLTWREAVFAYHSASQDVILPVILSSSSSSSSSSSTALSSSPSRQLTWPLARDSLLFSFLSSRSTLIEQFEQVARAAYASSEPKNPADCSLHYLALRKKALLVGLWQVATWSGSEKAATLRLLRNDFSEARWRTAALKNAYALMGRRRFAYAAAFFLLAEDLRGALGVLANRLGDLQLAIAVGRVFGGDGCVELRELVRDKVVRVARRKGDRWMACWGLRFLGEEAEAVGALVVGTSSSSSGELVLKTEAVGEDNDDDDDDDDNNDNDEVVLPPAALARGFANDDPASLVLYRQLRAQGARGVRPREEWRGLVRTAGLLRRMGCDVLALDLVKNWDFHYHLPAVESGSSGLGRTGGGRGGIAAPPDETTTTTASDVRASPVANDRDGPGGGREVNKVCSMLDDFVRHEENEDGPAQNATRDMTAGALDSYETRRTDMESSSPGPEIRSILDDFGGAGEGGGSSGQSSEHVASMLDGFGDTAATATTTAGTMTMARPSERSGGEVAVDEKGRERQGATAFKEPSASSILDNFGF